MVQSLISSGALMLVAAFLLASCVVENASEAAVARRALHPTPTGQCANRGPHHAWMQFEKLGAGYVSEPITWFNAHSDPRILVEEIHVLDCKSYQEVQIQTYQSQDHLALDDIDDALANPRYDPIVMERLKALGDRINSAEIEKLAKSMRLKVRFEDFSSMDGEDCGCNLYYPELRGERIEYQETH